MPASYVGPVPQLGANRKPSCRRRETLAAVTSSQQPHIFTRNVEPLSDLRRGDEIIGLNPQNMKRCHRAHLRDGLCDRVSQREGFPGEISKADVIEDPEEGIVTTRLVQAVQLLLGRLPMQHEGKSVLSHRSPPCAGTCGLGLGSSWRCHLDSWGSRRSTFGIRPASGTTPFPTHVLSHAWGAPSIPLPRHPVGLARSPFSGACPGPRGQVTT